MPRQPRPHQLDLFAKPNHATGQMPHWQTLPAETRRSVSKLMVSLILGHVDSAPGREEERDDA